MTPGLPPPLLVFRSHTGDEDYESAVDAREIVGIVPSTVGERTVKLPGGETATIPRETMIVVRGCSKTFNSTEPAKDLIVRWIDVMRAHDARARDTAR